MGVLEVVTFSEYEIDEGMFAKQGAEEMLSLVFTNNKRQKTDVSQTLLLFKMKCNSSLYGILNLNTGLVRSFEMRFCGKVINNIL